MPTITRDLYKFCASVADKNHVVLTMDFAQNLTLPSAAETPLEWYFLSLISVSMFGIHDEHQKKQTNFLYSERKGKEGPNEGISMLDRYVDTRGPSSRILSVFADNCGGQNKNNFVLKYLVALTHTSLFKEINYNFFIKGHTKNSCDRGFGVTRRKIAKSTLYTVRQLHDAVMEASVSSERVLLEEEPAPFRDFKKSLDELYRNVKGIQKYQLFQMWHDLPGSIICRAMPDAEPDVFDLRCKYDGAVVTAKRALRLLGKTPPLLDPSMNPEKVSDIYKKVAKYVPTEHRGDMLYQPPTAEQEERSRATKKSRMSARPLLLEQNSDPK